MVESPTSPTMPPDLADTSGDRSMTIEHADYVLCIEGDRSWRCPVPRTGELVVGRGPDAGLQLQDDMVSRAHAQLMLVPDGLRLMDLGSRHGTFLNGKRVAGAVLLASGDVITIGRTLLVVHRPARTLGSRSVVDMTMFCRRLEEEIERALRYQRELCVAALKCSGSLDRTRIGGVLPTKLRLMDCAAIASETDVVIVLPEVGIDEAQEMIASVMPALAPMVVAVGLASSPSDGIDVDSLLSGVRAAAETAPPGTIALVRDEMQRLSVNGHEIVLADPAMIRLYELARRLARSDLPILIQGETGVGKEVAAATVHRASGRTGELVSINCAAIPESLAESELFGYEKGAFTGAFTTKRGQLEMADGGTVFLDEIGDLSLAIQAKLLRVLETKELTRVGDLKPRPANIRVVAATNRDLEADVTSGRFRRDLYFRLAAAQLVLPPLRDRPRDLSLLANQMLAEACAALGRKPVGMSVAATQALFLHSWPGNIRELKNAMRFAAAALPDSSVEIDVWHLPPNVTAHPNHNEASGSNPPAPESLAGVSSKTGGRFRPIADELRELERARIVEALAATDGIQNQAAALIEMPLRTFVTKLKRYAITPGEWAESRK